ncbi:hypothetical protein [Enterobacter hormaechei]|uniref:hypothetical protein n=1 Tax=Enterobacter hormaechei TaxID=158836 RepID=UPI002E1998C3|nr:hypothetical protein [Enterobacter hormaechei]
MTNEQSAIKASEVGNSRENQMASRINVSDAINAINSKKEQPLLHVTISVTATGATGATVRRSMRQRLTDEEENQKTIKKVSDEKPTETKCQNQYIQHASNTNGTTSYDQQMSNGTTHQQE